MKTMLGTGQAIGHGSTLVTVTTGYSLRSYVQ
jgi:hypothetical protein